MKQVLRKITSTLVKLSGLVLVLFSASALAFLFAQHNLEQNNVKTQLDIEKETFMTSCKEAFKTVFCETVWNTAHPKCVK
jgi:hypothetical protein